MASFFMAVIGPGPKSFPRGSCPSCFQWWKVRCACAHHYFLSQRQRSPSRRLRRVMVERLVRIYIIGCLAVPFHSQIQASALLVHHPVRVTPGSLYFSRTSRVRGPDTLWRVPWTRLFGVLISLYIVICVIVNSTWRAIPVAYYYFRHDAG